jgi:hypothetical protein
MIELQGALGFGDGVPYALFGSHQFVEKGHEIPIGDSCMRLCKSRVVLEGQLEAVEALLHGMHAVEGKPRAQVMFVGLGVYSSRRPKVSPLAGGKLYPNLLGDRFSDFVLDL